MSLFNFFDERIWEPLQRRHPWLRRLDDAEWKTWLWHSAIAVGVGQILGLLPWVTPAQGMTTMVVFYLARETWNIAREGNRKYWDAFLDVWVPAMVVATVVGHCR